MLRQTNDIELKKIYRYQSSVASIGFEYLWLGKGWEGLSGCSRTVAPTSINVQFEEKNNQEISIELFSSNKYRTNLQLKRYEIGGTF